jgi:endogenous inhibitor of DNA gyrase (YacG/DUF329 family)
MIDPARDGKYLPFCTLRCRMIDLGRWLNEEHALPCESEEPESEESQATGGTKLPPGWHDA